MFTLKIRILARALCFSSPAMNSIIAQFDVNPYHWPGWAQASLSASVGLLTLLFFVETRSLSQAKTSCSNAVSCLAGIKLEAQLQTKCSKLAVSFADTTKHFIIIDIMILLNSMCSL